MVWKEEKHSSLQKCSVSFRAGSRSVGFYFSGVARAGGPTSWGEPTELVCGMWAAVFGFQLKSEPWDLATAESRSPWGFVTKVNTGEHHEPIKCRWGQWSWSDYPPESIYSKFNATKSQCWTSKEPHGLCPEGRKDGLVTCWRPERNLSLWE